MQRGASAFSSIRFLRLTTARALAFRALLGSRGLDGLVPHTKQRPCRQYSCFSFSEVAFRITDMCRGVRGVRAGFSLNYWPGRRQEKPLVR